MHADCERIPSVLPGLDHAHEQWRLRERSFNVLGGDMGANIHCVVQMLSKSHGCHVFADRSAYHTHACVHTSLRLSLKRPTGASLIMQREFDRLTQCAFDDTIQFGEHNDARCRPAGWRACVRVYSASDSFIHRTASPTRPNPTRPVRRRKLCT